jgi:hypothetical protein
MKVVISHILEWAQYLGGKKKVKRRTFGELICFNSKLCVMQKKICQYILDTSNIC